MDKEFEHYMTKNAIFDRDLYYKEVINGANRIFTELFGKFSYGQIKDIIQSFSIKQSNKNIFRKSSFGWIYFIEDEERGLIKIGMTDDVIKRFSQLKTNYKFCGLQGKLKTIAMCAVTGNQRYNRRNVEKFFHNMFFKYYNYMEWYKIDSKTLLSILNQYIDKKKYVGKNIDGINIFLMNDYDEKLFQCNFTEEIVRKRLDPFYKEKIISIAETYSLEYSYNKLYDVFMNELNEIYLEDYWKKYFEKVVNNLENVVNRIENKYLNLNKVFFEQVEKEKDVLLRIKQSPTEMFQQTTPKIKR